MSTFPRKQTPAQKIKRLEKQLADEKLRTELLNTMIDMSDERLGTSIRKKKIIPSIRKIQQQKGVSLSRCCVLYGISRQAIYQSEKRHLKRQKELLQVKKEVQFK